MEMPCSRRITRLVNCLILTLTCFYLVSAEAAKTPKNQLPIANAGLDQLAGLGQSVSLNASQSYDPDGTLKKYQWLQIKGAKVKIAGANTPTPTFVTPKALKKSKPVDLVFKLTVTDNRKGRAIDKININVSTQPCTPPQQLQNGACVTPNPAVETTTVQAKLDGLSLASTRYTLMSDDDTQPFSPQTQITALNIDTSTQKLVMLVNEQNQPILMSRNHAGDKAVNIDIASTAEVFLLAQPYFFGVQISDTKALSSRIRQHPQFADLMSALQTKINAGSSCPLSPACNLQASDIADTILETLDIDDLLTQPIANITKSSSAVPMQARLASATAAAQTPFEKVNNRVKVNLDDSGRLTVSNSYLTNYVLRGRGSDGQLGGWKFIGSSDSRLDIDIVDIKKWDGWYPNDIDWKFPEFKYVETEVDLNQLSLPSNDWRNTDLVVQGGSIVDVVSQTLDGKLSWDKDGLFIASLWLMNAADLVEISAEAYSSTTSKYKDKSKLFDKIQPIAKWFEKQEALLADFELYVSYFKLNHELLGLISKQQGVVAGDGSYLGAVLENSHRINESLDVLLKSANSFIKIKDLELNGEKEKISKKLLEKLKIDVNKGKTVSAALTQAAKSFEQYADTDALADKFLELSAEVLVAYEQIHELELAKLKEQKADTSKIKKKKSQLNKLRCGRGILTLGRFIFSIDKDQWENIKTNPGVIIPAFTDIGLAAFSEIATEDNVNSVIGNFVHGGLDKSRKAIKNANKFWTAFEVSKTASNRLIPFIWDAVLAENYLSTSIVNGQLNQFGPMDSKVYILRKSGNTVTTYTSSTLDTSQNLTIQVKPGDELKVMVELARPMLFSEERSPWLTNSNFPPSLIYDTSVNVAGRFFERTVLCAKKTLGNLTYSVHELSSASGDYLVINNECTGDFNDLLLLGRTTIGGGDWYINRNTNFHNTDALINSAVYPSMAALPDYYELGAFSDIASRSVVATDFFPVQMTDNTINIYNTGYNANASFQTITLEHITGECTLPWGGSLQSGVTTPAYQTASVSIGNSCVSELRTCTEGVLSGSYQYPACTVQVDSDGDGMPDDWETDHGLNPAVNDASLDKDGDFVSNLKEYQDNTDPADKNSFLPGSVTCTAPLVLLNGTCFNPMPSVTGKLNDTGITTCSNATSNSLVCPVAGFPGQDAESGRDFTHNDDSDGHAGFSFTKLDSTGSPLPAIASEWDCVKDNVTGLIWEVKTTSGLRSMNNTYSWYETDSSKNGGNAGTQNGGNCTGSACDTTSFVHAVNAQGLCGASDWRIPNVDELLSIIDNGWYNPKIDPTYFPNTPATYAWSSTATAFNSDIAWCVSFFYLDDDRAESKNYNGHVRLVRGGQ